MNNIEGGVSEEPKGPDAQALSPVDAKIMEVADQIRKNEEFLTQLGIMPKNERTMKNIAQVQAENQALVAMKATLLENKKTALDDKFMTSAAKKAGLAVEAPGALDDDVWAGASDVLDGDRIAARERKSAERTADIKKAA